ncbi:hypothetical protein ACOMHN_001198 [Nucella lapillus]
MRTLLGKLKKERSSGCGAPVYTATQRWVLDKFKFLQLHITSHVSSTLGLQPPPRSSASSVCPPSFDQPSTSAQADVEHDACLQQTPPPPPPPPPPTTPLNPSHSGVDSIHSGFSTTQPPPAAESWKDALIECLARDRTRNPLLEYVEQQLNSMIGAIKRETEIAIMAAVTEGIRKDSAAKASAAAPTFPQPTSTINRGSAMDLSYSPTTLAASSLSSVSLAGTTSAMTDTYLQAPAATFVLMSSPGPQPPLSVYTTPSDVVVTTASSQLGQSPQFPPLNTPTSS